MKKIGYVILTWNSESQILPCLDSIFNIKNYENHVIVIDNGSSDSTISKLRNYSLKNHKNSLEVIYLNNNIGTTKSRNMGLEKIIDKVDYICILDSDTIINENALKTMEKILLSDSKVGMIGPLMKTKDNVIQNSGRKFPSLKIKFCKAFPLKKVQKYGEKLEYIDFSEEKEFYEVDYLMSACWFMKAKTCKKIGKLDENIFYAPEDVDYCMRAHLLGYKVVYTKQAIIIHEWQRLSKKKLISKINFEHIKGLCYFFKKYHYWMNSDKAKLKEKV
jgi:GT2 family glycosyltransferase